ncbi:E3 ubiquitin-protein ligase HAKAI homolog [Solanum stenotomum]|uniref:E3 ubiquitin-protein ligase HAKAI homolog n=1 Tax=Solanum stenotomum TaxID=172797 RepID=UPI0020D067D7|nr:E3 ubiquitin-protein ligase HAKAI homolog [Solanum stenotomum]
MLRILLNKRANESGGVVQRLPPETVKVVCPDHLVLADLPVAKSLGSVNPASLLKTVGRRSLRPPGKRVHICICCDFPIAVYGHLVSIQYNLQPFNFCPNFCVCWTS